MMCYMNFAPIAFSPGNQLFSKWAIPPPILGTNRTVPAVLIRAIERFPLGFWDSLGPVRNQLATNWFTTSKMADYSTNLG